MTDPLEALYAAPAAVAPPRTPADRLRAASDSAFRPDTPTGNALGWWLRDIAAIHVPDPSGRRCDRDGDDWPCLDIRAAEKFAEQVNMEGEVRL
ncbi:hypothetical protein ACFVAF_25285 [Streptomyces sp. NPDC057596]|uniref:hypothetical protein n=1 Tax=Streptomyces sp. NPDC057596 TaxID=3346178 RepID=UPI0036ACB477